MGYTICSLFSIFLIICLMILNVFFTFKRELNNNRTSRRRRAALAQRGRCQDPGNGLKTLPCMSRLALTRKGFQANPFQAPWGGTAETASVDTGGRGSNICVRLIKKVKITFLAMKIIKKIIKIMLSDPQHILKTFLNMLLTILLMSPSIPSPPRASYI